MRIRSRLNLVLAEYKAHLPFDYSLTEPKGRCECVNFRIARPVRWIASYRSVIYFHFYRNNLFACIHCSAFGRFSIQRPPVVK